MKEWGPGPRHALSLLWSIYDVQLSSTWILQFMCCLQGDAADRVDGNAGRGQKHLAVAPAATLGEPGAAAPGQLAVMAAAAAEPGSLLAQCLPLQLAWLLAQSLPLQLGWLLAQSLPLQLGGLLAQSLPLQLGGLLAQSLPLQLGGLLAQSLPLQLGWLLAQRLLLAC